MRPYVHGEDLTGIIVENQETPELGGAIERNPNIHSEQWYVGKNYFQEELEEVLENEYLSFGQAIEATKKGKRVARKGWNGKGLSIELQVPDEHSKMTLPYLFMNYPSKFASESAPLNHINARVPWLASQTDILSEDWFILD